MNAGKFITDEITRMKEAESIMKHGVSTVQDSDSKK